MSNNKNPFSDFLSNFGNQNLFSQNLNFDKAINTGKENAKALSDAVKAFGEGFQAIARCQSENIQKNAEEFSEFFKSVSSTQSTEDTTKNNADFAKKSIDSTFKNINEISEIAAKSSKEASEIIGQRISSAISEVAEQTNENAKNVKKKAA